MNSKVIHIPDLNGFQADPELTAIVVTEDEVQEKIVHLAKIHGELTEQDEITAGCGVICENEEGRKILLYPSLGMPGLAEAENEVKGKRAGDSFQTVVAGKNMALTVKQILLYRSCEIDDTLAQKAGMEGVFTLEDLKVKIEGDLKEKKRQEASRMLIMEMHQYLCSNAETVLDEEEIEAWTKEQARISYEENLEMGIDLRFTETGEMVTEEEIIKQLAEDMRLSFVSMLVNQKFCEERGFTSEKEGMEADNEYFQIVYQELTKKAEEMMV